MAGGWLGVSSHRPFNESQIMNLNELAKIVHAANIKWWQNPETGEPIQRNRCELLALAISEISECLEGERKDLMDDHLPHRKMAEVELADAKIRLLDFAGGFNIEIWGVSVIGCLPPNKGEALFSIMKSIVECNHNDQGNGAGFRVGTAIARIEAYARQWGYDIQGAFEEKMLYNMTRRDHSHEARQSIGGKKF